MLSMRIPRGAHPRTLVFLATWVASGSAQTGVAPYVDLGPSRAVGYNGWDCGDVDGDGFADILAIQSAPTPNALNPQHMYVLGGPDGAVTLDLTPAVPGAWFYSWAEGAADLNGDGFRDLLLSVGGGTPGAGGVSAVEVRSGLDGALLATILPPTMLIPGGGMSTALTTGAYVKNAGDLNGDGGEEFLVFVSFGGGVRALLVYSAPSFQVLYSFGPVYGSPGLNGSGGIEDIDGDGMKDLFIAPGLTAPSILTAGRVEFYSGATGAFLYSIEGTAPFQYLGSGICGLDDVNGDGSPEIALTEFPSTAVRIRVVSLASFATLYTIVGGIIPWRMGDADGDAVNDLLVRGGTPGGVGVFSGATGALVGSTPGSWNSAFGDVNGDGLSDFGTNYAVNLSFGLPQAGAATSLTWPGLMAPPAIQSGWQALVYTPRNLRLAGPVLVGGSAAFDLLIPKHANRAFQVLLSLEGSFPGAPVGPFYFPLANDALLQVSLAAGIGGVLGPSGTASITVPVPSNPALQGLQVLASGVVADPTGPLGIGCVLTPLAFQIQ